MNKINFVIDRFEGTMAVCEKDGAFVEILAADLPVGAREGSVLAESGQGVYVLDEAAETERRKNIRARFDRLVKR